MDLSAASDNQHLDRIEATAGAGGGRAGDMEHNRTTRVPHRVRSKIFVMNG